MDTGESQVSAGSCCDKPQPVCGPGLGHIGQGHIVQSTLRPKHASSKGWIVHGTERTRTFSRGHIVLSSSATLGHQNLARRWATIHHTSSSKACLRGRLLSILLAHY
jgi:hypothetical protein